MYEGLSITDEKPLKSYKSCGGGRMQTALAWRDGPIQKGFREEGG